MPIYLPAQTFRRIAVGGIGSGILAVLAAGQPAGAAASPGFFSVPRSIASNCSVDVSTPLTNWISSIPDGSTISFRLGGCYRLDHPVTVTYRNSLSFVGNGATFDRPNLSPANLTYPYHNSYWQVRGGSNISMTNMSVVGPNVSSATHTLAYSFEAAYEIVGVNGVSLTHISAATVGGDGLTVGGESSSECDEHVFVNGLTVNNVGRQGVAIVCVNGATFDNAVLNHPGGLAAGMSTGFDLEPNGATASVGNVEIENSKISARVIAFSAEGAQDVSGIYIHNNTVVSQDNAWPWVKVANGPLVSPRHDWRVISNTVEITLLSTGLSFSNINNVDIEDNSSPVGSLYPGVTLNAVGGTVTIFGNNFGLALVTVLSLL